MWELSGNLPWERLSSASHPLLATLGLLKVRSNLGHKLVEKFLKAVSHFLPSFFFLESESQRRAGGFPFQQG